MSLPVDHGVYWQGGKVGAFPKSQSMLGAGVGAAAKLHACGSGVFERCQKHELAGSV